MGETREIHAGFTGASRNQPVTLSSDADDAKETAVNRDTITVPATGARWANDNRDTLEAVFAAVDEDPHRFGAYASRLVMWVNEGRDLLSKLTNRVEVVESPPSLAQVERDKAMKAWAAPRGPDQEPKG